MELLERGVLRLDLGLGLLQLRETRHVRCAGLPRHVRSRARRSRLPSLQLGGDLIGHSGAQHLASALPHMTGLEELHVTGAELGDVGASHVAEALAQCRSLRRLELRANRIHALGAQAVGGVLWRSLGLERVELCENMIGDRGATLLARALTRNPPGERLEHLGVKGNNILAQGLAALARVAAEPALAHRSFLCF